MAKHTIRQGGAIQERPALERKHTVARYSSPLEAHMVRGLLEAEGIDSTLSNELFSAVDSPVAVATGGVAVQVREAEFARAAEVLRAQEGEARGAPRPRPAASARWVGLAVLLLVVLLGGFLLDVSSNLMSLMHHK